MEANGDTTRRVVGVDAKTGTVLVNVSLGYWPNSIAVDPYTHVVYAAGCAGSFVCDPYMSILDGANDTLLHTVHVGRWAYPRVTLNPRTGVVYASGVRELLAVNGSNGKVIYNADVEVYGPFDSMVAIPSSTRSSLSR